MLVFRAPEGCLFVESRSDILERLQRKVHGRAYIWVSIYYVIHVARGVIQYHSPNSVPPTNAAHKLMELSKRKCPARDKYKGRENILKPLSNREFSAPPWSCSASSARQHQFDRTRRNCPFYPSLLSPSYGLSGPLV